MCVCQINTVVYVPFVLKREDAIKTAVEGFGLEAGSVVCWNLLSFSSWEHLPLPTRGDLSSCHLIDPLQSSLIWGKGHRA